MINQQLLDFIKKQIEQGVNRETITKELLGNSWSSEDIEEAFKVSENPISSTSFYNNNSLPPIQTKKHFGVKKFLIVLILILLVGGASAYYFRSSLVKLPVIKDFFPKENVMLQALDQQTDCSKIADQQSKFFCVLMENRKTNNYKACDQFEGIYDERIGNYKDGCYYDISLQTKDIKLCDNIINQKTKDTCYSANSLNEDTCNIIKTPSAKARCLEKINPLKITSQLCDLIDKKENNGYEYNYCYHQIVEQTHDVNLCKKITTDESINGCFFDIATKKLDVKICDMINVDTGSKGRNWCIVVIGRLTNNKTLCNLITGEEEIASCKANI